MLSTGSASRRMLSRDLLPCAAAEAAGGIADHAVPLAAYWSIMVLAARILDDWQDDEGRDQPWFDQRRMPAISTALVGLGQIALSSLSSKIISEVIFSLGNTLLMAATAQAYPTVKSSEQYERYLAQLTGAVWANIAWAGAKVGTANGEIQDTIRGVGFHCGMVDALIDECKDLAHDLERGHCTLPVLYGVELTNHPLNHTLCNELDLPIEARSPEKIVSLLQQMNVLHKVSDRIEKHRIRATQLLDRLPSGCKVRLEKYAEIQMVSS